MDEPTASRFWAKVVKAGPQECWMWTGAIATGDHGTFYFKKRLYKAHRVSWIVHRGPIPKGKCVLHTCHHGRCVNPNHLYVGTQQDNMHDLKMSGRRRHTKCMRGHLFNEENTRISYNKKKGVVVRQCRKCDQIRAARRIR